MLPCKIGTDFKTTHKSFYPLCVEHKYYKIFSIALQSILYIGVFGHFTYELNMFYYELFSSEHPN